MLIHYIFIFPNGRKLEFRIDPQRDHRLLASDRAAEKWTDLEYSQCPNCPLKKDSHPRCPAALDLQEVIEGFRSEGGFQKVQVEVHTSARNYAKQTGLEEGLRSMMGLIMATSGCPILSELRPMAMNHVPFSSNDEFILRSVSSYLLQQFFNHRDGQPVDWELKGLVDRNQRLQIVNQALWQRIHAVCEGDSSLKALLSFFSLASSITFSLESQLRKLRRLVAGDGQGPANPL